MNLRKIVKLPTYPIDYPVGSFIHTSAGWFYISAPNRRLRILNTRVLRSWSPPRVIETTEAAVREYRVTAKLKYRNGSLIHNIADGKIYLIAEGRRRHITSPDALERIAASRKDVVSVSLAEIKMHEEGGDLN